MEGKNQKIKTVISMARAVQLLEIRLYGKEGELVPTDVSDINILCPVCSKQHSSKRLTCNINFVENVFGCCRCDFNGGTYKFISYYTGWPYDQVETRIKNGELRNYVPHENDAVVEDIGSEESVNANNQGFLAKLRDRDEVYNAFLDLLTLDDSHRNDLLRRGLTNEEIDKIKFRSFPRYMPPKWIPKKLTDRGYNLTGVPGFGINSKGTWVLSRQPDGGFLIPSRNGDGLIQGFQIRYDHPSSTIPKYGYLTSAKMTGGAKCGVWCNWVGEILDERKEETPFDVILIEGGLKAYIVGARTGCNVISVPGVNALKKVPSALQNMTGKGLRKVLIAYDMDAETNEQVHKQLERLRTILDSLCIQHETLTWDSRYKGLDDWIVESEEFKTICPK